MKETVVLKSDFKLTLTIMKKNKALRHYSNSDTWQPYMI